MENANRLELHYYFDDKSHEIDAVLRNMCESELLAVINEIAVLLDIDTTLVSEAYQQGGFREFWKFLGKNVGEITVLLLLVQVIITLAVHFPSENDDLEKELNSLSIEEKKLSIKKLKLELQNNPQNIKSLTKAAKAVTSNLKIIKRRSNFYSNLEKYQKINKVGFVVLNDIHEPVYKELEVIRTDFKEYILHSNKLKPKEDNKAEIEIISPVLKEGRYKWRGIYNKLPISFEMQDVAFKNSVLFDNVQFQNGTFIKCVLFIHREIDELGEIKITGYSVSTVIEKIDGNTSIQTTQGKEYLQAKRYSDGQADIFKNEP